MILKQDTDQIVDVYLEDSDKIVPCPFCGCASVELEHTWTASYWMKCTGCGVELHGDYGGDLFLSCADPDHDADAHLASAEDALKRWNTRAEVQP